MPRGVREERPESAIAPAPAAFRNGALPARRTLFRPARALAPAGAPRAPRAASAARHQSLCAHVRLARQPRRAAHRHPAFDLYPLAEGTAADARLPAVLLERGLRGVRLRAPAPPLALARPLRAPQPGHLQRRRPRALAAP